MIPVIELAGSPYEMGVEHGRRLKEQIHGLARERYDLAVEFSAERGHRPTREECLALAADHLVFHREYAPDVFDEWRGIAEGAGLSIEDVFFANALTDFQDVLCKSPRSAEVHGCTSFAVAAERTDSKHVYVGQTWDMHASAEAFIAIFRRRPHNGPASITMTTAGCLSLIGLNEAGIAIGNNNLRPTDARPGVVYLAMIHRALQCEDWDDACRAITDVHRASGHNYIMGHHSGLRTNIETSAERYHEEKIDADWYVHTNHYLDEELRQLEEDQLDRSSSLHRYQRLSEGFDRHRETHSPDSLRRLLSDHDGDELCICRHGEGRDARSCAFVVSDPVDRSLRVSLGPPCEGEMQRYGVAG